MNLVLASYHENKLDLLLKFIAFYTSWQREKPSLAKSAFYGYQTRKQKEKTENVK
jgi:hypothetical protein